ncbi:MAG: YbaK/EbsC family protein [Polyangiales bacterium]
MISQHLATYLAERDVDFDVLRHERTPTIRAAAHAAHVPERWVAKGVVYEDGSEFVMAVVPANRSVDPLAVAMRIGHFVALADEADIETLLRDCARGAIPPLGEAWGVRTLVDPQLLERSEVWFEGGDHERLVHVQGPAFSRLVGGYETVPLARRH